MLNCAPAKLLCMGLFSIFFDARAELRTGGAEPWTDCLRNQVVNLMSVLRSTSSSTTAKPSCRSRKPSGRSSSWLTSTSHRRTSRRTRCATRRRRGSCRRMPDVDCGRQSRDDGRDLGAHLRPPPPDYLAEAVEGITSKRAAKKREVPSLKVHYGDISGDQKK